MPLHKALKPFGWYPDGFTREALEIGDERDFGDATEGMVAAKMIVPVGMVEAATKVDVAPALEPAAVDLHEQHQTAEMAKSEAPAAESPGSDQPKRRGRGRK